ncbi:hypothetical protein AB5J62_15240 [Amycolatopsis sp. cg5]|uniref:hypothetical protein n=1 Tax=Amycolatopsis sp. cg5 TaxID=3238802 RepID=UPI003523358A
MQKTAVTRRVPRLVGGTVVVGAVLLTVAQLASAGGTTSTSWGPTASAAAYCLDNLHGKLGDRISIRSDRALSGGHGLQVVNR